MANNREKKKYLDGKNNRIMDKKFTVCFESFPIVVKQDDQEIADKVFRQKDNQEQTGKTHQDFLADRRVIKSKDVVHRNFFMCDLTTVLFDECLITPPCNAIFSLLRVYGRFSGKAMGLRQAMVKVSLNESTFLHLRMKEC